ncbi:MAG TPA: hydroxyisourate hydrolase [Rubrivivax sp.]
MTLFQTLRRFASVAVCASALATAAGPAAAQQAPRLPAKLSTHALDTFTGKQASGIRIDLYAIEGETRRLIKTVRANDEGRVTENLLNEADLKVGRYEIVFHVAEYYRSAGVPQSSPEFLDVVPVRVAIYDASLRYHVPLYFSPWSFMSYRGS